MNMTVSGSRLGTILRRERTRLGVSSDTLAKRVGLSAETYADLETGALRGPGNLVLTAIAAQFPRNTLSELARAAHRDRLSAASVAPKKKILSSKLGSMLFKARGQARMTPKAVVSNLPMTAHDLLRIEGGEVFTLPAAILIALAQNLALDASEVLLAARIDQATNRRG